MDRDWLTAEQAMERLGIRPQTLYAYVSRGRIEARPDPDDPRRSRYRLADVGRLVERKKQGRKAPSHKVLPQPAAQAQAAKKEDKQ